ncbi:MAG TPA: hypothetical protein VFQ92_20685, partial [Blastocatellia bacterium]|nr:hypothetical protein [Blastocatellia bacterium]
KEGEESAFGSPRLLAFYSKRCHFFVALAIEQPEPQQPAFVSSVALQQAAPSFAEWCLATWPVCLASAVFAAEQHDPALQQSAPALQQSSPALQHSPPEQHPCLQHSAPSLQHSAPGTQQLASFAAIIHCFAAGRAFSVDV